MEFRGLGLVASAKRRAYRQIVDACGGDVGMADELVECFAADTPPSLSDLRRIAAHAREVAAEVAGDGEEEDRCAT